MVSHLPHPTEEYHAVTNPVTTDLVGLCKTPTLFLHAEDDSVSDQRNIDECMYLFR